MAATGPPPWQGHEGAPLEGTAYSVAGPNTGLPADTARSTHYPIEGICRCGEMVRAVDLRQERWEHLGRKPGEA